MHPTNHGGPNAQLVDARTAGDPSRRLRAALAAGTRPDPRLTDTLVDQCAVEPDFFVRAMLTWALCRLPTETTVPRLVRELGSNTAQATQQLCADPDSGFTLSLEMAKRVAAAGPDTEQEERNVDR